MLSPLAAPTGRCLRRSGRRSNRQPPDSQKQGRRRGRPGRRGRLPTAAVCSLLPVPPQPRRPPLLQPPLAHHQTGRPGGAAGGLPGLLLLLHVLAVRRGAVRASAGGDGVGVAGGGQLPGQALPPLPVLPVPERTVSGQIQTGQVAQEDHSMVGGRSAGCLVACLVCLLPFIPPRSF